MKLISEANFREINGKFLLVICRDLIEKMFQDEVGENTNGFFAYGYIDEYEGLSLRPFLLANTTDESVMVNNLPHNDNTIYILRVRSDASDVLMSEFHDGNNSMYLYGIDPNTHFIENLEDLGIDTSEFEDFGNYINEAYKVSPMKEKIRTKEFSWLDQYRNPMFPDDVLVTLYKDKMEPEQVWVRTFTIMDDGLFFGELLNEPWKDFGCHEYELIGFRLYQEDDFETLIYTGQKARLAEEN